MALLILGKSKCALCGEVIEEVDEYRGFPPFVLAQTDPLYVLNDTTVHSNCLASSPLAARLEKRLELINTLRSSPPASAKCGICGGGFTDYLDYCELPFFSEDQSNPLSQFNCGQYHKKCFECWAHKSLVCQELSKLTAECETQVLQRLLKFLGCAELG